MNKAKLKIEVYRNSFDKIVVYINDYRFIGIYTSGMTLLDQTTIDAERIPEYYE